MPNISTQTPFWKESEMFTSTEDQELSSRDSEYQTGLPQTRDTVGNLTPTQERLGTMPFTISCLKQPQLNSSEKDKNQTLSNGSDSNNGVRELLQDSSTTKFQSQCGTDMVDIWMTQRQASTHSPMPTKTTNSSSVLTPPLKKAENNSRKNGKLLAKLFQNLSPRMIWFTHMNTRDTSPMNHTSEECGNTTENICSESDLLLLPKEETFLRKMLKTSLNLLTWLMPQHSQCTFMEDLDNSHISNKTQATKPPSELCPSSVSTKLTSTESQLNHTKNNSGNNTTYTWN